MDLYDYDIVKQFSQMEFESQRDKYIAIGQIAAQTTSFIKTNYSDELAALEQQKEAQLKIAGDDATARENIERQFANQKAIIERKQFFAEKRKALADVAIVTALAVAKALPNIPIFRLHLFHAFCFSQFIY